MYCKNCGKPMIANERFCSRCGTPVDGDSRATAYTVTTIKSSSNSLLGVFTLLLLIVQGALWFFPTFRVYTRDYFSIYAFGPTQKEIAMGLHTGNMGWLQLSMFISVALLVCAIALKGIGCVKNNKTGNTFAVVASILNLVGIGFYIFYYYAFEMSHGENFEILPLGYIQVAAAIVCIIFSSAVLLGNSGVKTAKTISVNPVETYYNNPMNYSSTPQGPVEHSGGNYFPSAFVPTQTTKCRVCGFDVPLGQSVCACCGTVVATTLTKKQ